MRFFHDLSKSFQENVEMLSSGKSQSFRSTFFQNYWNKIAFYCFMLIYVSECHSALNNVIFIKTGACVGGLPVQKLKAQRHVSNNLLRSQIYLRI
jgi:hypothetical protein